MTEPGLSEPAWPEQVPAANTEASGWLGLELGQVTGDPARLSDADLIDSIVGFERVSSWSDARQAALMAEFAQRRGARQGDSVARSDNYAADEIGLALTVSRPAASHRVLVAQTLTEDLPATFAAWERGDLDTSKAWAIAEASTLLPAELHTELETRVLPKAPGLTLGRLRALLRRIILALDPDGGTERHRTKRQGRRVVLTPEDDGMGSLWALLTAPDAVAAYQHLSDLARGLGAEDPRSMDARRADLLVDLVTGRDLPPCSAAPTATDTATEPDLASETDAPGEGGETSTPPARPKPGKPQISVIVPITMLLGLHDHPGELVGYGPIPADLAREIAAEGTWRRLLTDPASGALLDYGTSTYTPPASLARFVRARDVYCRRPNCGHQAAYADLDHTVPWPKGPTSEHNLNTACRHDHLIKTHQPEWSIEQFPDGRVLWTTPTGHTYTSYPHDYRPEPPPPEPTDHDPPPF